MGGPSEESMTLDETAGEDNFQEELTAEGLGPLVLKGDPGMMSQFPRQARYENKEVF